MKEHISNIYGEYNVVQVKNTIRDNKRIIVGFLTDNIFQLCFGFVDNVNVKQNISYLNKLSKNFVSIAKTVEIFGGTVQKLKDRSAELNTWLLHSEIVCYQMKVRVCEDIVVLLQHRNLIAEYNGRRFIKVGVIEKELGIMMRITKFDPLTQRLPVAQA